MCLKSIKDKIKRYHYQARAQKMLERSKEERPHAIEAASEVSRLCDDIRRIKIKVADNYATIEDIREWGYKIQQVKQEWFVGEGIFKLNCKIMRGYFKLKQYKDDLSAELATSLLKEYKENQERINTIMRHIKL